MPLAVAAGWIIGWAVGAIVVLVAVSLILHIIGLARAVTAEIDKIVQGLDGVAERTKPLHAVGRTHVAVSGNGGEPPLAAPEPEPEPAPAAPQRLKVTSMELSAVAAPAHPSAPEPAPPAPPPARPGGPASTGGWISRGKP